MQQLACQVQDYSVVGNDIYRVILRTPVGRHVHFHAGQYLEFVLPNGKRTPLSIANAPNKQRQIELHIQNVPGNESTQAMVKQIEEGETIRIELPKGSCYLERIKPDKTFVFIAGGSGFSQIKSMLEFSLVQQHKPNIIFYWAVNTENEWYCLSMLEDWQRSFSHFSFVPVVGNENQGRDDVLLEVLDRDFSDLSNLQIYTCGSPTMVYSIYDHLVAKGLDSNQMFSDVFDYAPRKQA